MAKKIQPCDMPLCRSGKPGQWNPTLLIDHNNPQYPQPACAGLRYNLDPKTNITLYSATDRELRVCDECLGLPIQAYMSESGWRDLRSIMEQINCNDVQMNRVGLQFERITNGVIDVKPWQGKGLVFLKGKIYDPYHDVVRDADKTP